MAPALRNLLVSLAGDDTTFQIDKTTALVSYDNDSTASYENLGNDLALAESNWSNAAASASSAWSLADDNATITALNGLNTAQGLPWTQFLADKAVTDRDCSVSQQADDLLYAANVNNEYVSFEAAAGAELTLLVSNTGTATVSWTTDVAMAAQTRIAQTADAAQAQKLGLAPLAETYQNALTSREAIRTVATVSSARFRKRSSLLPQTNHTLSRSNQKKRCSSLLSLIRSLVFHYRCGSAFLAAFIASKRPLNRSA